MIHIGNKIKETLKEQGRTVTWLAQQLCCDRRNIYKIFSKENIDIKQLDRISAILGVDFFYSFPTQETTNSFSCVCPIKTRKRELFGHATLTLYNKWQFKFALDNM